MTDRGDLEDRLEELEDRFGEASTETVVVTGDDGGDWPAGVDRDDITIERQEPGPDESTPLVHETTLVPIHRPPEFRGGIVIMSYPEIATVYASMPGDIREAERTRRIEQGEPIPPILQQ